jgi:hypothetical protein
MEPQQDLFVATEPQPAAVLPAPPISEPDTSALSLRDWIRAHRYQLHPLRARASGKDD